MIETQTTELDIATDKPLAALAVAEIMALTPIEFALFLDDWREAPDCRSPVAGDRGPCG
jgi:hypothetical protein